VGGFLRPAYRSAFRGSRAPAQPVQPPSVPSPVGAQTGMTAGAQANALRRQSQQAPGEGVWEGLPPAAQKELQQAYSTGGFDQVRQIPGWYDVPEHVRTQILGNLNRIE